MLTAITLQNFRNISKAKLNFSAQQTLIIGQNAQGKTNLMESISYFMLPSALHGERESDVIGPKENYCRIGTEFIKDNKLSKASIYIEKLESDSIKKQFRINGVIKTQAQFVGILPSIMFSPADMTILLGRPERRRKQLDIAIPLFTKEYVQHLKAYEHSLKQRNKLLEAKAFRNVAAEEFDYWENKMAHHGGWVMVARKRFIKAISPNLQKEAQALLGSGANLIMVYQPNLPISTDSPSQCQKILTQKLASERTKDLQYKKTQTGPQKDEWRMQLNTKQDPKSRDLGTFGSRGHQRLGILCFKLAQLSLYEQQFPDQKLLLLLDDPFSELDMTHRKLLLKRAQDHQTVITSVENMSSLGKNAVIYQIAQGNITAQKSKE